MISRKTVAIPSIAVLAVAGGLAVAGCGGSSSADTTQQSQQHAATTIKSDGAMKHDSGAMKDEGSSDSMKHESSGDSMKDDTTTSGDHMGG